MPTYKLRIVVEGSDRASGPLGNVASSLQRIGEFAAGSLLASGVRSISRGIVGMGREALGVVADFERLEMSLETLVAREQLNSGAAATMSEALANSGAVAKDLIGWIEELAVLSPFNVSDIANSFRLTMAYGFTADEAQRLTNVMTDFAAGSGATGDVMNRIALALGQIKARGKLAGQEIMQLTEAGIPVRQILAEAFGVTTAELEKMQAAGIDANRAIEAIVASLERDFAGAAERQAGTFSGLVSSLEDLRELGLRDFFTPMFKEAQPYLQTFVDTLTDPAVRADIQAVGTAIGTHIGGALTTLSAQVATFSAGFNETFTQANVKGGFLGGLAKLFGAEYEVRLEPEWGTVPPLPDGVMKPSLTPTIADTSGLNLPEPFMSPQINPFVKPTALAKLGPTIEKGIGPINVAVAQVHDVVFMGQLVRYKTEGDITSVAFNSQEIYKTTGEITTIAIGDATIQAEKGIGVNNISWNGAENQFIFSGEIIKIAVGENALTINPQTGTVGGAWNGEAFVFPALIKPILEAGTSDTMAFIEKLFTPGGFADTEFSIKVNTFLNDETKNFLGVLEKRFTPGRSEKEFSIKVNTFLEGQSKRVLAFFGGGEGEEKKASTPLIIPIQTELKGAAGALLALFGIGEQGKAGAQASALTLNVDDGGVVAGLKEATAGLSTWLTDFKVTLWAGGEGLKQKLLEGFTLPDLSGLLEIQWPQSLPWVTTLKGIMYPSALDWVTSLTSYVFPDVLGWVTSLTSYTFPDALGWVTSLTSYSFPESLGWVSDLMSWQPSMPGWVATLISILGGGGGRSSAGAFSGSGGTGGRHALGTRYFRGGLSMVGEFGPEMVSLPRGSAIYSAPQTRRMLAAQGGMQVNINIERIGNEIDVQSLAYRVADVVQRRSRG